MKNRITSFFPSLTFSSPFLTFLFPLLLPFLTLFVTNVATAQIPSSGLVGYWNFSGNVNDASSNGNNGIMQPGNNGSINFVTDRFGNANSAIEFVSNPAWNSLGPYVEIPNSQNLLVNSDFTITYSIKVSPQNVIGEIINKGADNISNVYIARVANGILQNGITTSGAFNYSSFPTGSWQTITISYSNSILSFYLNGILQPSILSGPILSSSSNYYFGAMVSGSSNGSFYPFQGVIDDISFYNRALTPAEINQIYTSQTSTVATPPCPTLATNLQTGLVGYWPFCGNANDESGNGNNGTVNGATLTTDRFGNANSAYSFDGNGNFISLADIDLVNNGTLVCWVKPNGSLGSLISKYGNGNESYEFIYNNSSHGLYGHVGTVTNANNNIYSEEPLLLNVWHCCVLVIDNGTAKIFLDGNLIHSQAQVNSIFQNNDIVLLGKSVWGGNLFSGLLDDISIYNRALSPAEITQLSTDASVELPLCPTLATNLQTGLVGYWPFCGNANDESGNGNNGTVNGATLTTDRFGNSNSAYIFDRGTTSEINYAPSSSLNSLSNITISMWVKLFSYGELNLSGYNHLINKSDQNNNHHFVFANNSSQLYFYFDDGSNAFVTNNLPPLNQWSNLTLVYNYDGSIQNSYCRFYIDGELIESFQTTQPLGANSENLKIGSFGPDYYNRTDGIIDDVSIYNRALTPTEVTQLYTDPSITSPVACTPFLDEDQTVCAGTSVTLNASSAPSSVEACQALPTNLQSGLVGYWPFCGNANDASGNGNNGTVNGPTLTTDRNGNVNAAFQFSNASDNITINGLNQNGVQSYSVLGWFKIDPQSPSNGGGVVFAGNTPMSAPTGLRFTLTGPNVCAWQVEQGNNTNGILCSNASTIYNDGQWHFFSAVFESTAGLIDYSDFKVYVDGNLLPFISFEQNWPPGSGFSMGFNVYSPLSNATMPLVIGNHNGHIAAFIGALDDFCAYNRALTPAEIQQLYTIGQSTYLWSTGATTASISVTPTQTTTYTCTVTDANGNACTDSVTVFVPQIEATDLTICAGESTTLSVSGINSTATPSACPTLPSNLQSGLVGYWPFCGNANDASGNGNNGTVNGATLTTDRFGNANSAYSFDGVNDGVQVAIPSIPVGSAPRSLSTWIYTSLSGNNFNYSHPHLSTVAAYGNSAGGPVIFPQFIRNLTGNLYLETGSSQNEMYSTQAVNNAQWHNIITTYDGSLIKMYVDGVLNATSNSVSLASAFSNLGIGVCPWAPIHFEGKIDDVMLFNRALLDTEIQSYYQNYQNFVSYTWTTGATTSTINVSPTSTTTYTCTATTNGVSCTDSVTVIVNNPTLNLGSDVTACGTSTTLTAPTGYDSYTWSNGGTTNTTTVTANGTYTCTVTQGGCSASDSIDVTLIDATISATDSIICAGESITLSVPQGGSSNTACSALPNNLQNGLVGYWPFCGNANDASGNGNNGTVNGATLTTDRFGNVNSAYSFDGVNDFIEVSNNVTFSGVYNFTNSLWCYFSDWNQSNTNYYATIEKPGQYSMQLYKLNNYSASLFGVTINILPNEWNNIVVSAQNGFVDVYSNGVFNGSTTNSLSSSNNPLLFGIDPGGATEFTNGKIDEIAIYNRSLTTAEIQQLYSLGQTTFLWSNGATTPTINVSPTITTTYTCTVTTNGVSCTDAITVVVDTPTATITPATTTTFCQGGSVVLNANAGTGLTYQWKLNGTNITGATSSSYTANASGSYTVVVTNASTCSSTSTATVVTVNALPIATIAPATATIFCQGGSVILNANAGTGLTYQWKLNGTNITGATTSTYTANASGSYTVVVTNASTCSATSIATVVTVNALPTATITPATATTFCQGGSVVLTANTGTGLTYQWRLNGTNITGATSSSYTANANGSYTVVVTNTSTCSATSAATVVTVNALPTATITAATATTFCQGGSVILNANTGTGLTYQWFNNATAITGATSAAYTANASGSYTVTVTNVSACSSTSTATVVTVNALPIVTITPATATTFCQGGSVVLNANTGTGLTYQWFNNATAIGGATSASYTATTSGSYTVVVTNASTCSSTSTATVVTVNALPTATITASSATTFCQGGSVVLNANTGAGLTYQWRLNGNPISGATSSSYTANASGSYTVVVTNASTCSSTSTATVVTVNALPIATIAPATATTFCQGGSVVLNANTGAGLSYQWRLNGNPISGATSSSYTANASGSYTVVVTNASTCSSTSTATVVTVNALPTATITAATATTFCQGGSVVLSANTGAGLSYQWRLNGNPISGATSSSYTANASGSYTVVVTNASTCSSTSTATVVTVNALPTATITASSATTFCQGGSVVLNANTGTGLTYQWFNNASIISGATSSSHTANASGSYTVVVTNASTCSSTSTAVDVTAVPNVDYFADADGDGFGDITTLISTCIQPQGYVTDNTDCKDNDASIFPGAQEICNDIDDDCNDLIDDGLVFTTYYADADGDTFGDANNPLDACVIPDGYVTNNSDCNDNNANQNAASPEICNGEDDDCDGTIDNGLVFLDYYADLDSDGFGAGAATNSCVDLGAGYVTNNTDCDDSNSNTNPSATEICNTIDDNCDGQIDEGVQTVYFIDNDGDTYGNPSVSILACTQPIGYTPDDTDCNDTDANINPGAEDIAGNGIDENCDGQIDNSIFELNATISLYPNPTRSELNIQVNSSIIGNDLYIFDAVGKLVHKQQLLSTQTTIPVSNFADGNYIVRVGEVVKRFEVMK